MAHDPLIKMFFDKVAAVQSLNFWELPLPAARLAFSALATMAGPKNVPIGRVESLSMPGPGGPLDLRLYTPVAAGCGPLPALLFFHGGGFVFGSLDIYDGICRMLAEETGARVLAVAYRLAPEHKFPAAIEDAHAAVHWLIDNARTLGIDAGRIAIGGDSAGGNLTAVTCHTLKRENGPRIAAQLLIAPFTHFGGDYGSRRLLKEDPILSSIAAQWFMDRYVSEGDDPDDIRLSPLLAEDFSGLPPAYLLLGGNDPLHDEGLAYADKLSAAGVETTVADYGGMMHDFVFLQSVLPEAREALLAAGKAVRAHLAR